MQLYITDGSPYARIVRMLILEKGLEQRITLMPAQTRQADSPYYAINPSGRVPFLVRDDGVGMEESALICRYLDRIDARPILREPSGEDEWEALRLEALARSMLDGLAVWMRELRRPPNERSPTILRHEAGRSVRLADLWERTIDHPLMRGSLNLAQLTLAAALGLEGRCGEFAWRSGRPRLAAWFTSFEQRPSYRQTAPAPR
jgi:glutathione S-transferase